MKKTTASLFLCLVFAASSVFAQTAAAEDTTKPLSMETKMQHQMGKKKHHKHHHKHKHHMKKHMEHKEHSMHPDGRSRRLDAGS